MNIEMKAVGFVVGGREDVRDDFWGGHQAWIELTDSFGEEALQGLADFSHIEVLFLFHHVPASKVVAGARHPRNNNAWPAVGIFAQRGKNRPNRIGTTICRVLAIEGTRVLVAELDAVAGTPVLDIKPVMSEFLPREAVRQPDWAREIMSDYWAAET